jgi:hypothetical protein
MEKKIITLVIFITIILGLIIYLIFSSPKFSPELEECKSVYYNSENAINILFFSEKDIAKKYADFLFEMSPFLENKEKFNIYYIDTYNPECEIYKGVALLCYNREIIRKASSCPADYIVSIKKEGSNIRSSAYMNVMSINQNHPLTVFPHELGHALAFLADEYVPATLPKKSENCVLECDEFENPDGCYEGCSKSDYYRSIESGIMRTLSSKEFGSFNSQVILNYLPKNKKTITGKIIQETTNCEGYYLIEGIYKDKEIKIIGRTIEQGCIGENGNGEFEYNFIFKDTTEEFSSNFNPELIFTDYEEGGEVLESNISFFLRIPIIKNLEKVEILKDDIKLTEINFLDIDSRPCPA